MTIRAAITVVACVNSDCNAFVAQLTRLKAAVQGHLWIPESLEFIAPLLLQKNHHSYNDHDGDDGDDGDDDDDAFARSIKTLAMQKCSNPRDQEVNVKSPEQQCQ